MSDLIAFVCGGILGIILIGSMLGGFMAEFKAKAVENKCAVFEMIDSSKGTTQFKWNNEK